ncbi:acyltransferase family protein [Limosilactobacillus reuteri]|uniref:acyltransferase family protein n=1 Tax=Limosilactobacillus reuteri TaxID=1598 RepID=UPI001E2E9698|nr:acyltransferase family protein [Limosilactobacillus reuteri]UFK68879.1 hypothetical protein IVR12_01978 [Limosilactobacillus reuteri]
MTTKVRDKSLDIIRGSILLVVLGHISGIPFELKKYIYSFHIPLFFFVSGYLFNFAKYRYFSYKEFIKYKAKKYILPYFRMGLICLLLFGIVYPLFAEGFSKQYMLQSTKYVLGLLYSRGGPNYMAWSSPLWFLTALFIAEIIFFVVLKFNFKYPLIVFGILAILSYIYSITIKIPLPWNIDVAMFAVLFMYLGFITHKYNLTKHINLPVFLLLIVIFVLSVAYNNEIDMNLRNYGNGFLTIISGTIGTVICLQIARLLKENKILEFYGKNTLFIMGYTYAVFNCILALSSHFSTVKNVVASFLIQIIILTLLIVLKNLFKQIKKPIYAYTRKINN